MQNLCDFCSKSISSGVYFSVIPSLFTFPFTLTHKKSGITPWPIKFKTVTLTFWWTCETSFITSCPSVASPSMHAKMLNMDFHIKLPTDVESAMPKRFTIIVDRKKPFSECNARNYINGKYLRMYGFGVHETPQIHLIKWFVSCSPYLQALSARFFYALLFFDLISGFACKSLTLSLWCKFVWISILTFNKTIEIKTHTHTDWYWGEMWNERRSENERERESEWMEAIRFRYL